MENSNPIEQMKGFAEKKLRVLRENPDESGTKAYLAKMRKGVGKVPGADPELWGILFEDLPEELIGRGISKELENLLEARENLTTENGVEKAIPIVEGMEAPEMDQIIYPIICEGDIIGSVIILSKDEKQKVSVTEQKLAGVAAEFLGRQMEA